MRFIKTPPSYKRGDERIITKFLWLPISIGDEIRWLEKATIKQKMEYRFDTTSGSSWFEWQNIQFI